MKPVSQQRLWQLRQKELGKCSFCAKPIWEFSRTYCEFHHKKQRLSSLRRQRKKAGIPIDEPLRSAGRKRNEEPPGIRRQKQISPKHIPLLGTMTDKALAEKLNLSIKAIFNERVDRRIEPYRKHS